MLLGHSNTIIHIIIWIDLRLTIIRLIRITCGILVFCPLESRGVPNSTVIPACRGGFETRPYGKILEFIPAEAGARVTELIFPPRD
jgi:hypothetical protein